MAGMEELVGAAADGAEPGLATTRRGQGRFGAVSWAGRKENGSCGDADDIGSQQSQVDQIQPREVGDPLISTSGGCDTGGGQGWPGLPWEG